ncbi:MAG: hypothetical protein RR522_05925, partial [Alistipes sp.]
MSEQKGFSVEVSSHFQGWWRYNIALMCGCFDAADQRTEFVSSSSQIAQVGENLTACPAEVDPARIARLEIPDCDHLALYLYIIPHTLPLDDAIAACHPFEVQLEISHN